MNFANDFSVFFLIKGNFFQNLRVQNRVFFAARVNRIAKAEELFRLVPFIQSQHHIGSAEQKQPLVLARKLAQGVNSIAFPGPLQFKIADVNALNSLKRQLRHAEAVRGGNPLCHFLVRRNGGRNHKQKIQPHLLHKSFRRGNMTVVGRRKGSAVNSDPGHGNSMIGFLEDRR